MPSKCMGLLQKRIPFGKQGRLLSANDHDADQLAERPQGNDFQFRKA